MVIVAIPKIHISNSDLFITKYTLVHNEISYSILGLFLEFILLVNLFILFIYFFIYLFFLGGGGFWKLIQIGISHSTISFINFK